MKSKVLLNLANSNEALVTYLENKKQTSKIPNVILLPEEFVRPEDIKPRIMVAINDWDVFFAEYKKDHHLRQAEFNNFHSNINEFVKKEVVSSITPELAKLDVMESFSSVVNRKFLLPWLTPFFCFETEKEGYLIKSDKGYQTISKDGNVINNGMLCEASIINKPLNNHIAIAMGTISIIVEESQMQDLEITLNP